MLYTCHNLKIKPAETNIMNLVMLDIDGTLTQSYEYDREIFSLAIAEVVGCPPVEADLTGYVDKTSIGVTQEAIQHITGRSPTAEEIGKVKRRVLWRLEKMHQESPGSFREIPGATVFMERLRRINNLRIAIATGCWLSEALYKLSASGLSVAGIPLATSDDDRSRKRIMEIAAEKAQDFYTCSGFEHIVYLGDGVWDMQFSRSLGYGFIGIGPRVQELKDTEAVCWHQDFLEVESVLASVFAAFKA
jgi:phosphoglycolate phosphatase-like HAD superfamily hydrolase